MKRIKRFTFDSYAILAYLEGEKGAEQVAEILKRALKDEVQIFLSVINWGEVYYIVLREKGEEAANLYMKTIGRYPIKIILADEALTIEAAKIKAFNKMSYSDAFAAALSNLNNAHLVTGDSEFKSLENEIKIIWI